jgi:hypothetical protein
MAQPTASRAPVNGCISCRHFLRKDPVSESLKKDRCVELLTGCALAGAAAPLVQVLQHCFPDVPDVSSVAWPLVLAELRVGAQCLLCTPCSSSLLGGCQLLLDLGLALVAGSSPFGSVIGYYCFHLVVLPFQPLPPSTHTHTHTQSELPFMRAHNSSDGGRSRRVFFVQAVVLNANALLKDGLCTPTRGQKLPRSVPRGEKRTRQGARKATNWAWVGGLLRGSGGKDCVMSCQLDG